VGTAQADIRVHQDPQVLTFRVSGRATMQQSPAFLRAAARSLAGGITSLRVDLHDCAYMDSTFLGSLLALKRQVDAQGGGRDFALLAPSPQCMGLLQQMGMDRVLRITGEAANLPDNEWHALDDPAPDRQAEFKETVVRAHQELAGLPTGSGADQFKAIASKLTQAWETEKDRPAN
jgi:anti-anti-sigma factor